ncbi:MAG: class I SAM-dependent methyltransferase [Chloroflexota bacterium]
MRLIQFLFRTFFYLLYHQFAWIYDLIAAVVSLGRWNEWVNSVLPYLDGRILEIGYGPGYLQLSLQKQTLSVFGLDESRQMAHRANHRLREEGYSPNLSRGYAQHLPFPIDTFDTIVATFPSEYVFDPGALSEIHRILVIGGKLIVVPMAWITGKRPIEKLAAWLFRITGEAPGRPETISSAMRNRFAHAGFDTQSELISVRGSQVLVIIATRTSSH